MLSFLNQYAGNVHSQNGEDLIIAEAWRRITADQRDGYRYNGEGGTLGQVVEAGGNDGLWLSNARYLIEQGWSALFVEADYNLYLKCKQNWAHNPKVRSQCSHVDSQNINAFVSDDCDILSLDLDGPDYRVFEGLKTRPKIVIIEIDSSYPPQVEAFNKDGAGTYRNTVQLGISKGFFLLVHCGNLIFVANEYRHLFPEIEGDGLSNAELYFNNAWVMEGAV